LLAEADATVNVGDVVAKIDTSVKAEVNPRRRSRCRRKEARGPAAAPAAPLLLLLPQRRTLHRWPRPCLAEKGVDAGKVKGSGPNGRITKSDVEARTSQVARWMQETN
jgi:pyruvate/2-oxoglutarate dehydrogenase complex dihydrolipoamide acyltransferase (E2) component